MTARAVCTIDLDALSHNLAEVQRIVGPRVRVCGVVKADAYGHGAVPVARTLLRGGASALAVACFAEAEELRSAGLAVPILIFGGIGAENASDAVRLGLTPVVWDAETLREIAAEVPSGRRLQVHLEIDTGMHRVGAPAGSLEELIRTAAELSVEVDGILSHLACADEPGHASLDEQRRAFEDGLALAAEVGLRPRIRHLAASAGLLADERTHFDMVRAGLALYGCLPHPSFGDRIALRPVMELRTHVVQVKTLRPGEGVGYGFTWHAERTTRLAVLPIGYGQGYPRALSNRAHVAIGDATAPVVGTVSMDHVTVDVTDVPGVEDGDEVVLWGGAAGPDVMQLGRSAGTIGYELLTRVAHGIPRVYRGG